MISRSKTIVLDMLSSVRSHAGVAKEAVRAWAARPVGMWGVTATAALVLAAPAWLMADDLRSFTMGGDECVYVADSRDWSITRANLLKPHNTHIVPIFRLWTFTLVTLSGRLENLPAVFGPASYLGLVAPMLLAGHLVTRETRQTAVGLVAMTALGVSSVVRITVMWYAAGQALWAGAAIVGTIVLARNWSLKGGTWRLALVVLAALAAPAIWSGGLLAGPAAIAYLWANNPSRFLVRSRLLAASTAVALLLVLGLSRRQISHNPVLWERHHELWPRPIQAVLHTAQAIAETLVFANLGLDVITTALQGVVLVVSLFAIWAWSRGGLQRVNPLEAAGATVVLGSYLMVYLLRGNLQFNSVRPVTWYHAIPQVGAVIFAAGWWVELRPLGPHGEGRLSRRQALTVLGLACLLCQIQAPRVLRDFLAVAPPLTPSETRMFPTPELQRLRAVYFRGELQDRQVRALARLDKVERLAQQLGAGPEALHRVFGVVRLPGVPENHPASDAFRLLVLPPDDQSNRPDGVRLHTSLYELLRSRPEARPDWIAPGECWPPEPSK